MGAGLLVQSLVEKGHSSIAGIFQMDDQRGLERYQGFLDAMQNQGLTVPDRNICWYTTQELDDFRQSQDISFLKKFLERITPTALRLFVRMTLLHGCYGKSCRLDRRKR